MRIIAVSTLREYGARHSGARVSLEAWVAKAKGGQWKSASDIQSAFPKAKVLNGDRVRFEIAGGDHRMIVAVNFEKGIAFIKFIGTHAEYDRVDALTVSEF